MTHKPTKSVDWYYHRKGCTTCGKMDAFLVQQGYTATETVNAAKQKLGPADALRLCQQVERVFAAKGKSLVELDLRDGQVAAEEITRNIIGPTGNLRAPTIRRGKTLLVGFHPEKFAELLP